MTYTRNIPISGDSLGGTRDRIRTNFQVIFDKFAINHLDFDEVGSGKHKFLQMPRQSAAPTTDPTDCGFYAKVGTNPAQTNLFFRGENSGFEYQLTKAISASTSLFGANIAYGTPPAGFSQVGGWTFLPGGLILQYGFYSKASGLGVTGTTQFPVTFNNPPYSISTIAIRPGSSGTRFVSLIETVPTTSSFEWGTSSGTNTEGFYWQAIGN